MRYRIDMEKTSVDPAGKSGEATYARILETTAWQIARDGIKGMRMSHVAAEAGVSNALLHYYFESRDDLITQAFDQFYVLESRRYAERLEGISHPITRLRAELLMNLEDDPRNRLDYMLWGEVAREALFDEAKQAFYRGKMQVWLDDLAGQIEMAKDAQAVSADVDAAAVALRLVTALDSVGWFVLAGVVAWEDAVAGIDRALMDNLGTVGPPPPAGLVHP
jgi:AcrR family transcriptional regulator